MSVADSARGLLVVAALAGGSCSDSPSHPTVPDDDPITVVPLTYEGLRSGHHSLVYDGEHFVVAWLALAAEEVEWELNFATFLPSGELVTHPTPVAVLANDVRSGQLGILADRYGYWYRTGTSALNAVTFDADGVVLDGPIRRGSAYDVDVETRDDGFDVFARVYDGSYYQVEHRRYDALLADVGAAVSLDPGAADKYAPRASWIPARAAYHFSFERGGRIRQISFDPTQPVTAATIMMDNGASQGSALAVPDETGGVLFGWTESSHTRRVFSYGTPDGPVWRPPRVLTPRNRSESVDTSVAALGDELLVAWQGNADTALPQIHIGRIAPATGEENLRTVLTLTDSSYDWWSPATAAGGGVFAVAYIGFVDGAARLRVAFVPR